MNACKHDWKRARDKDTVLPNAAGTDYMIYMMFWCKRCLATELRTTSLMPELFRPLETDTPTVTIRRDDFEAA